jgi:opacity protein-like surface antigen
MKRFTEAGRFGSRALILAAPALVAVMAGSTGASAQAPPPPLVQPGCTSTFPAAGGLGAAYSQVIGGVVGATNAISSVIGTMNTSFIAQGNAFVAGLPNPKPDEVSGGIWGRMIGGRVENSSSGTFNGTIGAAPGTPGSITCNSDVRMNYGGFQLGQDIARLNIGGGGSTLHIGVTGGYAEANAQDQGGSNFTGNFQIPFAGLYAAYTSGRFFADGMVRGDFYQMNLNSAPAALSNQRLNGLGGTVSASAGYRFDIGNNWFFEPSASAIYSKVNIDSLYLPGGFGNFNNPLFIPPGTVKMAPNESILGRVGGRIGTTYNALNITWQPFATASVWHEFAGNTTAVYTANGLGGIFAPPANGTLSNSRVGTYGQYSVGFAASANGSPLLGYLRVDYRNGSNIESLGFNGGLRYNFDPTNGPVRPGIFKAAPAAVAYDWTGFYLGAFGGAGFGNSKWDFPAGAFPAGGIGANSRIAGVLAGANAGYNKQYGQWVLGVEGDIAATNAKGGQGCATNQPNAFFPIGQNCNNDLKWIATGTAKVGYAWDRVLVYGKAGGAWTDNKLDASCNGDANFGLFCFASNNFLPAQNLVATLGQFGWVVGAGFELALTPSWSAKAEYNYMNFGSRNLVLPDTTLVNFKQDFNQVKIGVNYRFGRDDVAVAAATMPVKAKAVPVALFNWTGVYAGAAVAYRASVAGWETTAVSDGAGGLVLPDPTTTPASLFSSNAQGRLYSGYNWQISPKWVAGIEGDVGNGDSRMTIAGIPGTYGNGVATAFGIETQAHDSASVKMGWDGTIRGKLGMLVTPTILFYGTGGAAFQRISASASCDSFVNPFTGFFDSWCTAGAKNQTFSAVRAGWTAGIGIEAVVADNWISKVEARYADFGRYNNRFFAGTVDEFVTSVRVQTFTALAGVSYKFGPTAVVAKY